MANKFSGDLAELQDTLRLAMLAWRDHRIGVKPISNPKEFEDMLVAANFALAEIRLDIMAFERETFLVLEGAQRQLDESVALLREALAVVKASPVPSNVLVFTGRYRPQPDNDHHGGVA